MIEENQLSFQADSSCSGVTEDIRGEEALANGSVSQQQIWRL
jgi:hypothetical protein